MKKITLKKLKLYYFKGITNFEIDFKDTTTYIHGTNRAGKSTLFDAFIWLLFNKDASDNTTFDIKTLDENNIAIPKIEHIVEGILNVDQIDIVLKKVYREKWTKRRGSEDVEFTGHETIYWFNENIVSETKYNQKIKSICDEGIFRLLTNPAYFLTMDWKKQRDILETLCGGGLDDTTIAGNNPEFIDLLKNTNAMKSLSEYQSQINTQKNKLKKELELLPSRIDEVNKSMPDLVPDFVQIEKEIEEGNKTIESIDQQINSEQARIDKANNLITLTNKEINNLEQQLVSIENKYKLEASKNINDFKLAYQSLNSDKARLENNINSCKVEIGKCDEIIKELQAENEKLKQHYVEINNKSIVFDESKFICPTCQRELDPSNIEAQKQQMSESFNQNKLAEIDKINNKGVANKNIIDLKIRSKAELETKLKEYEAKELEVNKLLVENKNKLDEATKINTDVNMVISLDVNYISIKEQIETLKNNLNNPVTFDFTTLNEQKQWYIKEIAELNQQLAQKKQIEKNNQRIAEIQKEMSTLAQSIANLEKTDFLIEKFNKHKVDFVENSVNKLFSFIKFKMYEKQINGSDKPICKALINGVPYQSANTESKLNAGLDVIKTFSLYYNITAPIFIDNRESTIEIIPMGDRQIINLLADKNYKQLTIIN